VLYLVRHDRFLKRARKRKEEGEIKRNEIRGQEERGKKKRTKNENFPRPGGDFIAPGNTHANRLVNRAPG
jgi:hypothetical protein